MLASLCVTLQIKALSRTSLKPNRQVWQWRVDSWVSPSRGAEPVTRGSVELCSSKLQAPTSDQPTEHHHSAGRCGDSRSREAVLHDVIEWPWVTLSDPETLGLQEHPLLGQSFFMLHPCRTQEFMSPIVHLAEQQQRYEGFWSEESIQHHVWLTERPVLFLLFHNDYNH